MCARREGAEGQAWPLVDGWLSARGTLPLWGEGWTQGEVWGVTDCCVALREQRADGENEGVDSRVPSRSSKSGRCRVVPMRERKA